MNQTAQTPARQIDGLTPKHGAAAHDALSWLDAAPTCLHHRALDEAMEAINEAWQAMLAEDRISDTAELVMAVMDDLGQAGIVWSDDEGNEWLHICDPYDAE